MGVGVWTVPRIAQSGNREPSAGRPGHAAVGVQISSKAFVISNGRGNGVCVCWGGGIYVCECVYLSACACVCVCVCVCVAGHLCV